MNKNEEQFIRLCTKYFEQIIILIERDIFELRDGWVAFRKKNGKIKRLKVNVSYPVDNSKS